MAKHHLTPDQIKSLVFAGAAELLCIGAGVIAWLNTDNVMWLIIGIVASFGFSLPAIIKLIRSSKER